jgi:hypothetical protein
LCEGALPWCVLIKDIQKIAYVKVDRLQTEVRSESDAMNAAEGHEMLSGPVISIRSIFAPSLALE